MNDSRTSLRHRLLRERRELDSPTQANAADQVVSHVLARVDAHSSNGRVAAYLSYGGELDLRPSLDALVAAGHEIVLPVCGADFSLEFCPWLPHDSLEAGPYGIGEPKTPPVDITSIDTVLVPGVGFALDGSRIGHGAGYYDRFFARCTARSHNPRRLGIAHDLQVVELPPPETWDVAMHEIITPAKVIHVSN